MNTEQINELRKLAQAATPGPWVVNGDPLVNEGAPHLMTEDGYAIADFWGSESSLGLKGNEQNAAFIAAANPAAILTLIQQRDELLAALEQERKRLDWALANDAQYFMWDGEMTFCCSLDHGCGMYTFVGETNDPRPEIDEFMESQALTERKS